jgi:cytochrome P450
MRPALRRRVAPFIDQYPRIHEVVEWEEWLEGGLSKQLTTACPYHPGAADTVLRADGEAHRRRRRAMGSLLSRGGHQSFRDEVLVPTAEAAMAETLRECGPDGSVRVDLLQWTQRVNFQLAAAIVGLDNARTPEGAMQLAELSQASMAATATSDETATDRQSTQYDQSGRYYRKFVEDFYAPAKARRQELWQQVEDGRLDESKLPRDLLMLIVRHADPAWDDEDLAIREAIFLVPAAVMTTARGTVWTLAELFAWFDEHPADWERRFDSRFLVRAMNEALRLHPVTPAMPPRVALEDLELCQGTMIAKGEAVMFVHAPPNRDRDVFGEDAADFNPYRELPSGVPQYGMAFGVGPHMCWGLPLVVGAEGIDGNIVYLLKLLFRSGVQRDPENAPPPLHTEEGRLRDPTISVGLGRYPVIFRPEAVLE